MDSVVQRSLAKSLPQERHPFVIIERALRAERTSYHVAPTEHAHADPALARIAAEERVSPAIELDAIVGASWITDAPHSGDGRSHKRRQTERHPCGRNGSGRRNRRRILFLAHVTNSMRQADQDFEKGEADGTADALAVLEAIIEQA